jgi:hypothetical protein
MSDYVFGLIVGFLSACLLFLFVLHKKPENTRGESKSG